MESSSSNSNSNNKNLCKHRFYKTIGIDDVFLETPDPAKFPQQYLNATSRLCADAPSTEVEFFTPEIVGKLKCSAEDFIVREIAKKDRLQSIPGDLSQDEQQAFRVADLIHVRPLKKEEPVAEPIQQQEEKDNDDSQQSLLETAPVEVLKNLLSEAAKQTDPPIHPTPDEVIESLNALQQQSLERIKTLSGHKSDDKKEISLPTSSMTISPYPRSNSNDNDPPPLDKGSFHKALRFAFPLLQSKSQANSNEIEVSPEDFFDDIIPLLYKPEEDLPKLYQFHKKGCVSAPSSLPKGSRNRKRKRDSADDGPVLRLPPNLSKDDRRTIHHILSTKNRSFQTNTLSDYPLEKDQTTTTAIVVLWHTGAQKRARQQQNKRQRRDNHNNHNNYNNEFPNTLCVLKKQEKEHLTAVTTLCSAVRCPMASIGLAGIKDMKAVTYQYCTFRNIGPMRLFKAMPELNKRGIEIGTIRKVNFNLNTGDLEGNRFDITMREIRRVKVVDASGEEKFCDCDKQHLQKSFERVQRCGFVNFFGEQRVGTPGETEEVGFRTFDVGRAMLQGDFTKAIDLVMTGRSLSYGRDVKEDPHETRVRKAWKESGGDPVATLKEFPKGENMPRERALMKGLNRYGKKDPLAAIQCLPYNARRFWINAYQSFVWNTMASARIKQFGGSVAVGDLYQEADSNGILDVKVVKPENLSSVKLEQVVLPLPGFAVRYPENEVGALYSKLLAEDGIEFQKQGDEEKTAKGAYRHLVAMADNMQLRFDDGESGGFASTVNLQFDLPAGCYATMLFRELMFTTVARD